MTKEDLEVCNHDGGSAIHLAADKGLSSLVNVLVLERGVNVNLQSSGKKRATLLTSLHHAVKESRLDTVSFLLSHEDCDPSITDAVNRTPLHYAVRESFSPDAEKVLRLLLSHMKVDVNSREGFYTPFQAACFGGKLWSVKILMSMQGIQWAQEEEGDDIMCFSS